MTVRTTAQAASAQIADETREQLAAVTRTLLKFAGAGAARAAAEEFAPDPALRLEPGWSFGSAASREDLRTVVRREIWAYFAERKVDTPVSIPWLEGLQLRVFLGNDLSWCTYVGGAFEPNEFLFWKSVLGPGMVFVDGGANEGVYTLFASRLVGPSGAVLAIEPSTREIERLKCNVAANDLENVRILCYALGGSRARRKLAVAEHGHEGQNALGRAIPNKKVKTAAHQDVTVTTLDRLVKDEQLTRVDGVKLDLEGAEQRALRGSLAMLKRFRPLLQIELNEDALRAQRSSPAELTELLGSIDYRVYVFDDKTGRLRPSRGPDELHLNVVAAPADWRPPKLSPRG